jgi:hypothetical protein
MQTKPRSSNTSSPSSSGVLPSPQASGYLPPKSPSPSPAPGPSVNVHSGSQGRRSRSSTASSTSSSSEATARPTSLVPNRLTPGGETLNRSKDKGKGKEVDKPGAGTGSDGAKGKDFLQDIRDAVSDATDSTFALPRRIFVNPFNPDSNSKRSQPLTPTSNRSLSSMLDLIPPSIRAKLTSPYLLSAALPVPIIFVLLIRGVRRRLRRRRAAMSDVVSDRLRRARLGEGLRGWIVWYIRWWLDKFKGVWKMGTTITWM